MTKIIFAFSFVVFLCVSACLAIKSPQMRGLGQDAVSGGMLTEGGHLSFAVQPAEGMHLVDAGHVRVPVSKNGIVTGQAGALAWFTLHSRGGNEELVSLLAEAPRNMIWPVNPQFTEMRSLQILSGREIKRDGEQFTASTFVREKNDAWMELYRQKGQGWEGPVMVRQYVWWGRVDKLKLIIEYREPLPEGAILPLADDNAARHAFEMRADASFTMIHKDDGGFFPSEVAKIKNSGDSGVPLRILTKVLGEVSERFVRLTDD